MCGIVGFLSNKGKDRKRQLITKMVASLAHRGPDEWGLYTSPLMTMGQSRLSIIDLSGGVQPLITERYAIIYNGEIFNYIELRKELCARGVTFQTDSDTEVIVRMYEQYGESAVKQLNGQFAFLLWDRKKHTLLIARDRYGIRPLYVLQHKDEYYFASEMKAFDCIEGFEREFDIENLYEHALFWNTLSDRTVYQSIRSVQSGTYETYTPGQSPRIHRYYELGETQSESPPTFEEAKEEFWDMLQDSVRLRLRSDVPVGNYLSGGIDSSAITYLTSKINRKRFNTYSVTFQDKAFDESSYQRELVSHINAEHNESHITSKLINDTFIDTIYHCERPLFRTAPVPLFKLSELVHGKKMKVVLTGEAADEILFGYDSYKELQLLEFWNKDRTSTIRPLLIKKLYPHLKHFRDERQFGLMRMFYEGFLDSYRNELASLNIRVNNNKIINNFFNKDLKIKLDMEKLLEDVRAILPSYHKNWSLLQLNQHLEMKTLLSGYLLSSQGDRMSLAHGVEGRFPFLDHRLVERVFSYKDTYKLHFFSQKHLLRETFRPMLPERIIDRAKMPYQAPDLRAFYHNGSLSDEAQFYLSDELINEYGIFDSKFTQRFLRKFQKSIPENIGYRDNMIITFLLSTQMAQWWARNPRDYKAPGSVKKVDFTD